MRTRSRMALLVAAMLWLAGCGAPGAESTTTTTATTTTPPGAPGGASVADSDLGRILVDPDGMTLYVFTPDAGGESTCYDDCAVIWPPVPADTPIGAGLEASMFGSTERADGTDQLTVNGWPLYLFASDSAPGDVNGQGVEGVWFVVDVDGEMVTDSAATGGASGTGTTTPDDYGY